MDTIVTEATSPTPVQESLSCIPFSFPAVPQVKVAFGTVTSGSVALRGSAIEGTTARTNRARLLKTLRIDAWSELLQVHGDTLLFNPSPTSLTGQGKLPEADGAATTHQGMALVIKTADCQPVFLTHRTGRAVAALHVGWRGNVLNFPGSGLARFCETYGFFPADVLAVRGPSLGPGYAEFVNFAEEWPRQFSPWFDRQRKTMDLWSLTRSQLIAGGMLPEHIFSLDLCTYSLPEFFFSYRRGHTGRQASLVWLTSQV